MRTRFVAWLFAFLLLGMQQGAQMHALSHTGSAFDRPQEQGLQLPVDDAPCAICALFAGGSNAIASGSAVPPGFAAASAAPRVTFSSLALHTPTYYQSRAPPTPL